MIVYFFSFLGFFFSSSFSSLTKEKGVDTLSSLQEKKDNTSFSFSVDHLPRLSQNPKENLYNMKVFLSQEQFYLWFLENFKNTTTNLRRFPLFFSQIQELINHLKQWKKTQDLWIKFVKDSAISLKTKRAQEGLTASEEDSLVSLEKFQDFFLLMDQYLLSTLKDFKEQQENPFISKEKEKISQNLQKTGS